MSLLTLWRVGVVLLLGLATLGFWLRPAVRVEQMDCVETWRRLEGLERRAQEQFVQTMLAEAARLRAWDEPAAEMKRIRLRSLQDALAAAETKRRAIIAETEATGKAARASADAEVTGLRDAVTQEERATYDRAEALAFLRARGIPLRGHP